MRNGLIVGGTVVGTALLLRRLLLKSEGPTWEKVLDRMPDTAPPKWMYRNITAIRENTDKILELLSGEGAAAPGEQTASG